MPNEPRNIFVELFVVSENKEIEEKFKLKNLSFSFFAFLAYVEPHQVVIKDKSYLFFNEHDYFYINDLTNRNI